MLPRWADWDRPPIRDCERPTAFGGDSRKEAEDLESVRQAARNACPFVLVLVLVLVNRNRWFDDYDDDDDE